MGITPDVKDWTWVLARRCPECGFEAAAQDRVRLAADISANAAAWKEILEGPEAVLRRRIRADRWSPLEYGCHVRDVFRLYHERLALMLTLDDPTFANWDQDRAAEDERYNHQDPVQVSAGITTAAQALASAFEGVSGPDWDRPGQRSDGARFTVESFGRYMIHDPIHHLHDVRGDLARPSR